MASTSTRSARRAGGLVVRSELTHHQNNTLNRQNPSHTSRKKRPRDSLEQAKDEIKTKKPRITLEIDPRLTAPLKKRSIVIAPDANPVPLALRSAPQNATTQTPAAKARIPPKYGEKVANGVKHELVTMQSAEADTKDDKRALRSLEGTRFKSELSAYFPDYDVMIGNEPEETHLLNIDTPIIIVDSNPPVTEQPPPNSPKPRRSKTQHPQRRVRIFPDALFGDVYQAQKVDFGFLDKHCKFGPRDDPLPDSYYEVPHKRAERLERSIRNSEKGRAQHERDQVIRLLEGLQGHDWLKVMGVSGITESKKKDYAPAREYFIKGCLGILEKFRAWREEEKRRKIEKEKAQAEAEAEVVEEGDDEDEEEMSDGDPPDYSDVDHAAARQLHQEAIARAAARASLKATEKKLKIERKPPTTDEPEQELKSFYQKRHLREAAIGKHRRSGRSSSAWGQPVPEVPEKDFELPEDLKDKDFIESNARLKRKDRRME